MTENQPPQSSAPAASNDTPGAPFYEKSRAQLKDLIRRKALLERNLANQEDAIFKKETEYLEDTPQGNIITGFEGYVKGGVQAAQRRGGQRVVDGNRVFSRSSVSFQAGGIVSCLSPQTISQAVVWENWKG
jgi:chromatin modification-related protein EAF6